MPYLRYDDGDINIPCAIIPISTSRPMTIAHVISYHVFKEICIQTQKDAHVLSNHVPYLRYDDGDEIIPYAIIPISTSRPIMIAHAISNQNSASSNSLSHESSALRTETKKIWSEYLKRSESLVASAK